MPIRPCEKDGKHGFKWGDGGDCIIRSTPEEAKKTVIRMGIKIEGPDKFAKIMKKEKGWSADDKSIAQEILNEDKGGWYSALTKNTIAEFAKKSIVNEQDVDQFGNKKKKPIREIPNSDIAPGFMDIAKTVETMEDKEQEIKDMEDEVD